MLQKYFMSYQHLQLLLFSIVTELSAHRFAQYVQVSEDLIWGENPAFFCT